MADPEFITFADKVAASLGMTLDETWDVSWHGARITDGMGRGYRPAPVRGSSTRVEISAVYPQTSYWFDDDDRKPITCARTRRPEAVAADITRRLAPRYEAVLARIRDWDAVRHAEESARLALLAAIEAAFPPGCVSFPSHLQSEGRSSLIIYGPGHLGGQIRMFFDAEDVEIQDLRVPRPVAVAMLAAFAAFHERGGRPHDPLRSRDPQVPPPPLAGRYDPLGQVTRQTAGPLFWLGTHQASWLWDYRVSCPLFGLPPPASPLQAALPGHAWANLTTSSHSTVS